MRLYQQPNEQDPGLDEVVDDPSRLSGLPKETLQRLLGRYGAGCEIVRAELLMKSARTIGPRTLKAATAQPSGPGLNENQIAARLGVNRRWLFRNRDKFPFIKQLSAKKLFCEEAVLEQWIKAHPRGLDA